MTTAITDAQLVALEPSSEARGKRRLPVLSVAAKLQSQATLTAVERFAKLHDEGLPPQQSQYYRDLIPLERPGVGSSTVSRSTSTPARVARHASRHATL